jgi:thiol-disulfide isomerase/thioredoxin
MAIFKRLFRLTVIQTSVLLFAQNMKAQSFTLTGTITGKDSGYAVLFYFRDAMKQRRADTTAIRQGKFEFSGTVTGTDFVQLEAGTYNSTGDKKYRASFFIVPGLVKIAFKDAKANNAVITGSKIQQEYDLLLKHTKKETDELNRLSAGYTLISSQLKDGSIDSKTATEKRNEIDKVYNPIVRQKSNKELSYMTRYPNSYVSLLLLYTFVGRLSPDSIDIHYSKLSENVKGSTLDYSFLAYNSRYRKAIAAEYPFDKVKINEIAPHFLIYNTVTNDSISVDDLKGKVLLLEFWGLYCYPCLKANPTLEDIRKQFGKEKLEIIAINNNEEQEVPALVKYINKNRLLEWIHVSTNANVKQVNSLMLKGDFSNYSGLGVPRTILIDKNGRVVLKNYGYSIEEMDNLRSMINKLVNEKL